MENAQPQPSEIVSQPPIDAQLSQSNNQLPNKIGLFIGGILLLTVGAAGGYYLGTQSANESLSPDEMLVYVTPQPTEDTVVACTSDAMLCPDGSSVGRVGPNCEFSQCPTNAVEKKTIPQNWVEYSDATYSFKYPSAWKVEPGLPGSEEYHGGDVVTIISPKPTVSIMVSPSQSPYGFGGPSEIKKGETLQITVNNTTYTGTENIRVEDGVTKVYVDMPVKIGEKEYHFLFGTGYPVNKDSSASYEDYQEYRTALLDILSTLTISTK